MTFLNNLFTRTVPAMMRPQPAVKPPRPLRSMRTASVILNASGYGYCTVYLPDGVTATMTSYSFSTTQTDQTVVPPQFTSYLDSAPNISRYFESSGSGNRGSSDTPHDFLGAEPITGEWSGGTAGSIATLTVVYQQLQV